jgi:hypothetical protein
VREFQGVLRSRSEKRLQAVLRLYAELPLEALKRLRRPLLFQLGVWLGAYRDNEAEAVELVALSFADIASIDIRSARLRVRRAMQ